jgi:FkbM family methyltransferase
MLYTHKYHASSLIFNPFFPVVIMSGIFKPIIIEPIKHIYNMLSKQEYSTYNFLKSKIGNKERYQEFEMKLHKWNLLIPDSASFLSSYKEIFLEKIYDFKLDSEMPRILDIGANIGLSTLFFKSIYPKAQITAFEADPKIYKYLEKNVRGNGWNDVNLINKAIWYENTTLSFVSDGSDAGHIGNNTNSNSSIEVRTLDIAEVLSNGKFDFVKMDIEGAEEFVLPRCRYLLTDVKFIFVEYHSRLKHKQCLDKIISILSDSGFRIYVRNVMESNSPFINLNSYTDFDLQLNVFGWKEK